MRKIPDRFIWATELLSVAPQSRIMEWGCGAGLWADQILSGLDGNCTYTGIDQSAAQIRMAEKRNKQVIDTAACLFQTTDLNGLEDGAGDYDFVIAFNLNLFRKEPERFIQKARSYLKATGKLVICFQNPSVADPGPEMQSLEGIVRNGGFQNTAHHTFFGERYPCACVMGW